MVPHWEQVEQPVPTEAEQQVPQPFEHEPFEQVPVEAQPPEQYGLPPV